MITRTGISSVTLMLASIVISSCATFPQRLHRVGFVAIGGASGAVAGAAFSPDSENRALNALVFGLTGALAGGVFSLLTERSTTNGQGVESLKAREFQSLNSAREITLPVASDLPEYVRSRLRPVVIEEFVERDHVSDEGTLHEPHKVYRIKRPAELIPQPTLKGQD